MSECGYWSLDTWTSLGYRIPRCLQFLFIRSSRRTVSRFFPPSSPFLPYQQLTYFPLSYPNNNCAAQFSIDGPIIDPQTIFSNYTTHSAAVNLVQPYLNSALLAQRFNKPFYMFETNTASCGGFPGISDSFGAALWGLDYGFQMAFANFTHAMLHTGGQNAFYNVSFLFFIYSNWYIPDLLYPLYI